MGEELIPTKEKGAAQHLHDALEAEEQSEKDFHVRQALQYLGIREDLD